MTSLAAITAALLLPSAAFLVYTDLNMNQQVFVKRLGCGCHPFFNTNHLSLLTSTGVLLVSALLWGPASRDYRPQWRAAFRILSCVASLWFLRFFMMHNTWL